MRSIALLIILFGTFNITAFSQGSIYIPIDGDTYLGNFRRLNLSDRDIQFVPDRFNDYNGAIKLNGFSSFIKIPININDNYANELTISLWAKADRADQVLTLFSHDNGNFDKSLVIDNRGQGNGFKWSSFTGSYGVSSCKNVTLDKWTHLVYTYSKNQNKFQLFVDGERCEGSTNYDQGLNDLTIGVNPSFGEWFSGAVDDIKIEYKQLSQAEVIQEYNSSTGPEPSLLQEFSSYTDPRAELVVQVGDIDNLGFGWPLGFDPFSGKSTPVHAFPYYPSYSDFPGTDRILVGSSYRGKPVNQIDGYTRTTKRPDNLPKDFSLQFNPPGSGIKDVEIILFIDDFQATAFGSNFQFSIDGKRIGYVENIINSVNQTGPIGKLITIGLLPQDIKMFQDGLVSIRIDDVLSRHGDGFAVDFIQLLINRTGKSQSFGEAVGYIKDERGNPINGVIIQSSGITYSKSSGSGQFLIQKIPFGLASLSFNKVGFKSKQMTFDLIENEINLGDIVLSKSIEDEIYISNKIKSSGRVDLYGIQFATNSSIPLDKSDKVLQSLLTYLSENNSNLQIIGHTDADGDDSYNEKLSLERSAAIKSWLVSRGIESGRLEIVGKGETSPLATNSTSEGKSINRRVEIIIQK